MEDPLEGVVQVADVSSGGGEEEGEAGQSKEEN